MEFKETVAGLLLGSGGCRVRLVLSNGMKVEGVPQNLTQSAEINLDANGEIKTVKLDLVDKLQLLTGE